MASKTDAVWSARGTTPDAIEAALRQLLIERHAENEKFVPARVLNMIAFVDREWTGEIANSLRGVGPPPAPVWVCLVGRGPTAWTHASRSPPKATPTQARSPCCARRWSSRSATVT